MYPLAETQPGMLMLRVDAPWVSLPWLAGQGCPYPRLLRCPSSQPRRPAAASLPQLPAHTRAPLVPPTPPTPQYFANSNAICDFIREKVAVSKKRVESAGEHIRWAGAAGRRGSRAATRAGRLPTLALCVPPRTHPLTHPPLTHRFVIIDLSPVTDIDSSAMHFLSACSSACLQCCAPAAGRGGAGRGGAALGRATPPRPACLPVKSCCAHLLSSPPLTCRRLHR